MQRYIWDAELGPGVQHWAAAGYDGLAHVYEAQSEPQDGSAYDRVYSLGRHSGSVTGIAFNAEGTRLATTGFDGTARLWDMDSGEGLMTIADQDASLSGVDFSPDGRYLATAGRMDR